MVSTIAGAAAGVAALLLSEAFKDVILVGNGSNASSVTLSAPQFVQAFCVGLVGLKWLVNYQSTQTLRSAVAATATQATTNDKAAQLAAAGKPRDVLKAAKVREASS